MAFDLHHHFADLAIAAQEQRNKGSPQSAQMLDEELAFAVHDAVRVGAVNPATLHNDVAHAVIARGGATLHELLVGADNSAAA